MKTTEQINGFEVNIEWEFKEIVDTHDSNWAEWSVIGKSEDGRKYQGTCFADATFPTSQYDKQILNIEEI